MDPNVRGYIGSYDQYTELITCDGYVIRRMPRPDGMKYEVIDQGIKDIDAWLTYEGMEGIWTEVDQRIVHQWLQAVGAKV